MDLKLVRKLIRLMRGSDLVELELEEEGHKIKLRRKEAQAVVAAPSPVARAEASTAPPAQAAPAAAALPEGTVEFKSPMVGTFYRSPSPEAEAFVSKGSKVTPDSVLCIIEAMKVMNEIKAELDGEIVDILVKNGEPVEFGQPLFIVKTG